VRRGPERLIAWVSSACLVLVVFSAAVVGVASTRVTQEQARAAHLVAVAGRLPVLAGRIEALVAMMADPRTDPARIPGYRQEVARAARQLLVIGDGRSGDDPQIGLSPAESAQLVDSLVGANPGLITRVDAFCDAAVRGSRPGADLAPGSLIRGDIDGEVAGPMITDLNGVVETIAAVSADRSQRWHRLVRISLLGLCLVTAALVWIILGP